MLYSIDHELICDASLWCQYRRHPNSPTSPNFTANLSPTSPYSPAPRLPASPPSVTCHHPFSSPASMQSSVPLLTASNFTGSIHFKLFLPTPRKILTAHICTLHATIYSSMQHNNTVLDRAPYHSIPFEIVSCCTCSCTMLVHSAVAPCVHITYDYFMEPGFTSKILSIQLIVLKGFWCSEEGNSANNSKTKMATHR